MKVIFPFKKKENRNYLKIIIQPGILLFIFAFSIVFSISHVLMAYTMQSSGYQIQSDSINFGGTNVSGSSSYKIGDTLGENGTGSSSSSNYAVDAGFWQIQNSSIAISISNPSDLALPNLGGISGGASEGTVTWNVVTDNFAGYSMTINSDTTPALESATDSFADYAPSGADPDYNFSVGPTSSVFGFTPEGVDIDPRFFDNGSACNTGSSDTSAKCWDGLSMTPKTIATRATSNQPSGTSTTVRFRAEAGASRLQGSGAYSATITVTATTL